MNTEKLNFDDMCREPSEEEIAQWDQAFAELSALEDEIFASNKALIEKFEIPKEDMDILMQDCNHSYHEKMEIVSLPGGDNQEEDSDFFKEIWVEQWSVGMSGDSYEGYIYAKLGKNQWLKIPYYC